MRTFCIALFIVCTLLRSGISFPMVVSMQDDNVKRYALIELESVVGEHWKFVMKQCQDVVDDFESDLNSDCANWTSAKGMQCQLRFRSDDESRPITNGTGEIRTTGEISDVQDGIKEKGIVHMIIKLSNTISLIQNGSEAFNGFHMEMLSYISNTILLVVDASRKEELVKLFENTILLEAQLVEGNSRPADVLIQSIASPPRICQQKIFQFFKYWTIRGRQGVGKYTVGGINQWLQSTLVLSNSHIKHLVPNAPTEYFVGMIIYNEDKGTMWFQYISDTEGNKFEADSRKNIETTGTEYSISQIPSQQLTAVVEDRVWALMRITGANFDKFTQRLMIDFDFGNWSNLNIWNGTMVTLTTGLHNTNSQVFTVFDDRLDIFLEALSTGDQRADIKVKLAKGSQKYSEDVMRSEGLPIIFQNYGHTQDDNVLYRRFVQFRFANKKLPNVGNFFSHL